MREGSCANSGVWNYDQTNIRRQDRLLDETRALDIIRTCEYGTLSMTDECGEAYGLPLNFVYDDSGCIYIHCAPEGRKLRAIRSHPLTSFSIVGDTHVISRKFTTNYESVILKCRAVTDLSELERRHALALLLEKYSPADKETGLTYIDKSFHRTEIIRLDIMAVSGKAKSISI
ncbi:MAG: pyridoxamine 5'-phosphate oxidase family protein [Duncaniella sp.]|nr:pyridoxamine 5'-phosphate oxidase family protein [Duncaniella sp.]